MMFGSALKSCRHKDSPSSTTFGAPGVSSNGWSVRPSKGLMPSRDIIEAVMTLPTW